MSLCQIKLCGCVLREHFGEVVEKVGVHLASKGASPLGIIQSHSGLKTDQVKSSLRVLIIQNLVLFSIHKRGYVEYSILVDEVLRRPRFPRYSYMVRLLYGDVAELLVEELLQHGQLELSCVVKKVRQRLNETLEDDKKVTGSQVHDQFSNLVETHFIQRCTAPEDSPESTQATRPAAPSLTLAPEDQYRLIPMDVDFVEGRKRKRSESSAEGKPAKRLKTDTGGAEDKPSDTGVYWRVNFQRFDSYLRDQAIINAVFRKLDGQASEVVRTLLRLSEVRSAEDATVTTPVSYNEIFQALPEDVGITKQTLDQYLKLLCEDSMEFLHRVGDSGGGMYVIDFPRVLCSLCKCHIESVVQERFGSKSLRIIRLLTLKKQLEQKQIEEFAMIPSKEAKLLLYRMFGEHFVHLTEVPKTTDHAPSRTIYLFSVNMNQVSRNLLKRCYKATCNMMIKRERETRENKRLLEKQQRVEAIAASLEQGGADAAQRQEIEEMITPSERSQLTRVKHTTSKLEQSEIQLDETILILQLYLAYTQTR